MALHGYRVPLHTVLCLEHFLTELSDMAPHECRVPLHTVLRLEHFLRELSGTVLPGSLFPLHTIFSSEALSWGTVGLALYWCLSLLLMGFHPGCWGLPLSLMFGMNFLSCSVWANFK